MARQLYLYSGINPNTEGVRHYFFNTASQYLNELQSHLVANIPLDNYRIVLNTAKIPLTAPLNIANYNSISYIIDYDVTTNYFVCYYVDSIILEDYIIYNLSVDLWATYILKASFSNIHVTRCNRHLSNNGIYDEIENTNYEMTYDFLTPTPEGEAYDDDNQIYDEYVYVVYLAEFNVQQSVFGDDHISKTMLFATPCGEFRNKFLIQKDSTLERALDAIGGIYQVQGSGSAWTDARIIQAWVMPSSLIDLGERTGDVSQTQYLTFKSKGAMVTDAQFKGYVVYPAHKKLEFRDIENNINKALYFGVLNEGLKLKRYTSDVLYAELHAYVSINTINVVMTQGDNQKDLTKDFMTTLTTNAGVVTTGRRIAQALSRSVSLGTSISSDISKGQYANAGLSLVKGIADMVPNVNIDKAIGGGDGSLNFYRPQFYDEDDPTYIDDVLQNPFKLCKFTSVNDENQHARLYGARFNEMIADFLAPQQQALLGTGNHLTLTDTYIVANCRIEGLPTEARNEVLRKLNSGIYYKYLTA